MSTLNCKDIENMQGLFNDARGKTISKAQVIAILQQELIDRDNKNPLSIDKVDTALLKDLINRIDSIAFKSE